jgi:nucleoid-associated protein Lsr2
MAQKVQVVLTCDLHDDDTPAVETVTFSFGGDAYEFELCRQHLDEFNRVMEGYASAARAGTRPRRSGRRGHKPSADLAAVRAWARGNGYEVSDRGRISAAVRDAFEAAHA